MNQVIGPDRHPDPSPATPSHNVLADSRGRIVNYMRLSLTDRCNLRCVYCRSTAGFSHMTHEKILRYEEILELARCAWEMGIIKLRLSGGEPLVRKGIFPFLEQLRRALPGMDLRLTTNATLLPGRARRLLDLGMGRINISLDTLDPEKFARITGVDAFSNVRTAIDECLDLGMRVKINTVAMKGVNDEELPAFVEFARSHPVDLRFIEFMPMGRNALWSEDRLWTAAEIRAAVEKVAVLRPQNIASKTSGPARVYAIEEGLGRIGLISPMSNHFCGACNRLRITADGNVRTCLFSDKEYRLRPLLRHPKGGREAVKRVLRRALLNKPLGAELLRRQLQAGNAPRKIMSAIGG